MSSRWILMFGALAATPTMAQEGLPQRLITVVGVAVDRAQPDIATLDFTVRGEGDSADAAAGALATRLKALSGGLLGLLGKDSELTTSNVNIVEVRDRACNDGRPVYPGSVQLSRGACAVVGYIAISQAQLRSRAVDKIATAAGLAARLGASDARVTGFALADPDAAQRRAAILAFKDARRRAETAAAGSGVKLGDVASIRDQAAFGGGQDIIVTAQRAVAAPPPPPPPISIDIKPRPIETRAQITVSYEIAR
ncbi:SIMPL domain-containing protein [Sphingomonas montanisoli]|nr:SIMPL domain-containing protein [Sphingomonas montanisoli]